MHESEYRRGERHGVDRSFGIDGSLRSRSEWRRGRRVETTRLEQGRLVWHEEHRFRSENDYTTETFFVDAPWRQLDIRPCQGGKDSLLSIDGLPVEGLRYDPDGRLREIHAYDDGVRIQETELVALPGEDLVLSVGTDGRVEEVSFHSRYTGMQRRLRFDRGRPLADGEIQSREPTHRPATTGSCEADMR